MAKKPTKPKAPAKTGRPTDYRPEYCQQLIEHMASGLSYESFAGVIEVSRQTIYDWEKVHEPFLDAKKIGAERNLLYWEKTGQDGLWDETEYDEKGRASFKKSLNSTVWIFNMKNRHRWKDKQEIELAAIVNANPLKEEMKQKTTEELLEIMQKAKNDE